MRKSRVFALGVIGVVALRLLSEVPSQLRAQHDARRGAARAARADGAAGAAGAAGRAACSCTMECATCATVS